jgi:two-component system, NtrC family, sensor kinase
MQKELNSLLEYRDTLVSQEEFNVVLEAKVAERTASLQRENSVLINEISKLKEIEEAFQNQQQEHLQQREELNQLFQMVERGKKEWETTLDCIKEVVVLVDSEGKIRRCNLALVELTGKVFKALIGEDIQEVFESGHLPLDDLFRKEGEVSIKLNGHWFLINGYHLDGVGVVITFYDYTSLRQLTHRLEDSNRMLEIKSSQLEEAYAELKTTQLKTLQQEKMASIGQLAAEVTHEINNPIGFISSNLRMLGKYVSQLAYYINVQDEALQLIGNKTSLEIVSQVWKDLKLDYITTDIDDLISESLEGAERVRKIVQDLKTFSRVDEAEWKFVDLVQSLESTINIVWNEIKYKAKLVRHFAELPPVRCYPHQLNQVFMNLLLNAAQAIGKEGLITVKAWRERERVCFSVADTGTGIPKENFSLIFEPFFTTKEVGKGTGLGLRLSYEIVKKHQGDILVESEVGKGTIFTVQIPIDAKGASKNLTNETIRTDNVVVQ